MIGLMMVRELSPLMTAIMLAGRSGSAFAAEIGTMKVNEELNALETMGLDPIRFFGRAANCRWSPAHAASDDFFNGDGHSGRRGW